MAMPVQGPGPIGCALMFVRPVIWLVCLPVLRWRCRRAGGHLPGPGANRGLCVRCYDPIDTGP